MITSRIFGGLGNQLFQYATARALADAAGTELLLDTRLAPPGNHWAYGLHHFNIRAGVAVDAELPPAKAQRLRYGLWRAFGRSPRFVRERGLGYDPALMKRRGDLYLHGYFQAQEYFAQIEQSLRGDLSFVEPATGLNAELQQQIIAAPSVSVHLRRGDYVSEAGSTHGTCDAAYYDRALDHLANASGQELKAYVFSDDPVWAREHMKLRFETQYVGHNGPQQAHEDLRLMASCTHHVIANSTFSWWGAWLNPEPAKCVVAPVQWFRTDKLSNPDIIPKNWHRV